MIEGTSAEYCLAVGKGLSSAVAGEPSIFSIRSKLANGENRIAGGDKFIVSIKAYDTMIPYVMTSMSMTSCQGVQVYCL